MSNTPGAPQAPTDERLLQMLAEMELLRRKSQLIEARLARWESRLEDACAVVDGLLGRVDESRDPEARLRALETRIERLARRRGPTAPPNAAPPRRAETPPPPSTPAAPRSIAIVLARWSLEGAPVDAPVDVGARVELVADVDGIAPEQTVSIEIHPLDSATALTRLDAVSDGDRIRAPWTVPAACAGRGWCFTASFERAASTSSPLYVA